MKQRIAISYSGPSSAAVRLGVVGDLHYTADPEPDLAWHGPLDVPGVLGRLRTGLAWFAEEEVDAVVLTGDLSHDGDQEALEAVLGTVAEAWSGTALLVAGNHDVLDRADALEDAIERLGLSRIALARAAGVVLGGVRIAGLEADDVPGRDGPLVVLSHYPLLSRANAFAAEGLAYAGDREDLEPLLARLDARSGPTLVISGHLHARDSHRRGAILQLTAGALVEAPFELAIVDIRASAGAITVRRRTRELGPPGPALAPLGESRTVRTADRRRA